METEIDLAEVRDAFRRIERMRGGDEDEHDVYPEGSGRGFEESADESQLLDALLFIGEEAFVRMVRRRQEKEKSR